MIVSWRGNGSIEIEKNGVVIATDVDGADSLVDELKAAIEKVKKCQSLKPEDFRINMIVASRDNKWCEYRVVGIDGINQTVNVITVKGMPINFEKRSMDLFYAPMADALKHSTKDGHI